jgi:NDP-sugar pyrophosphorylase family protein
MKNIVIAAGYATRLGELTRNFPKPLLQIGGSTILGRMLDDIDRIPDIDEHIIITNHRFAPIFEDWARRQSYTKPVTIVDDGTSSNETRLGAVCDLLYAMDKLSIDDDLLVVAADNILMFSFQEFVDFAKAKGTSCIMCHEQPSIERLQRTGVVVLDGDNRVLNMEDVDLDEWYADREAVPSWAAQAVGNMEAVSVLAAGSFGSHTMDSHVTRADAAEMLSSVRTLLEGDETGTGLLNWWK